MPAEVHDLVTGYRHGRTVYELSGQFGINRKTVSEILHREGVPIHGRLDHVQVDEAVYLYESGWSLARIGERLSVTANTVRARLLERGVGMRDVHGRKR